MRKDDCTLNQFEIGEVRRSAKLLLKEAGAEGRFPTPIDDLLAAAKLTVVGDIREKATLSDFLSNIGSGLVKKVTPAVSAVKGILGLLHIPSREILIDGSQHEHKQTWTKLHETGHGYLPHQKNMFELMEDGKFELDPATEDLFEKEANNFAAETLFQLDSYERLAANYIVSIRTPIDLSKKFGSSIYSSMRRYIQTHHKPLSLAIYDLKNERGEFTLRRASIHSQSFVQKHGPFPWPSTCNARDWLWSPLSVRFFDGNLKVEINGEQRYCLVQTFSNGYQIFAMLSAL